MVSKQKTHMRHVISLLIENESGALSRVSGLFSARGYNIESLTVAPTEDFSMSRMTIVTSGSDDIIEQITKQLNKLIEVVKVVDISEAAHIERELMLVKVRATGKDREEIKRTADIFRARIIDVTDASYVVELTGNQGKLDAFIGAIDGHDISDARTTFGQRARLVESDRFERPEVFERCTALHEHAAPRCTGNARQDRARRCDRERARACRHQHRHRAIEAVAERLVDDHPCEQQEH